MTIEEVATLVQGKILCGESFKDCEVRKVFASDLMSDVLTVRDSENMLLITGLSNLQSIRTCEMSDVQMLLVVRDKTVTDEMLELAAENDMIVLQTSFSMFRTCGLLYEAGVQPLF